MSSADVGKLHFVLVPLMMQGHLIPMVDLARLLAERGVLVSLITTPLNLSRIETVARRVQESGLPVRFVPLPFPCEEAGLPEGCENADLLPNPVLMMNFFEAMGMLREPLLLYLRQHPPLPSCIVSDRFHPWTRHVACELGVPRFDFYSMCCFTLLCDHQLQEVYKVHEISVDDEDDTSVVVPGLPLRIEVTKAQAPGFLPGKEWERMKNEVREAESMSHGVVVNTFADLEPEYVEAYQMAKGKKVWAIGPVSLCNKHVADQTTRGDKAAIDGERCLLWLDSMKPQSVLYVSFGSLVRTTLSQVVEIGMGLEATQHPFIWVIKAAGGQQEEVDRWLAERFEDRTRDRALIIKGWAPQMTILSHQSVGGFMTHCGWNSSMEAISAGVPMITWPGFGDQFLNERFIVEVLRVGVAVGVKKPLWKEHKVCDVVIKREEVEKAVNRLMDAGGEGEEMRRRVRELGKMAVNAMEVGGPSYASLTQLMEEMTLRAKKEA